MGLSMNDLHTPTVASGPTTTTANGHTEKKTLQQLILSKDNLEAHLSALGAVLDSHGVHMNTSLTTFDGYPRADIDVAQIRMTRAQIIHLKNDHKALMKELEEAVYEGFASGKSMEGTSAGASRGQHTASAPTAIEAPFARVNTVVPGSPAEEAGLQVGDRVTKFGYVDWTNHERLSKVAHVVQQNENHRILVKILREATTLELYLTPRKEWGGRGMLGCHLLPL